MRNVFGNLSLTSALLAGAGNSQMCDGGFPQETKGKTNWGQMSNDGNAVAGVRAAHKSVFQVLAQQGRGAMFSCCVEIVRERRRLSKATERMERAC